MNRKQLLALARNQGFTGKSIAELQSWSEEWNIKFFEADGKTPVNISEAWAKEVIVTATEGESIRLESAAAPAMTEEMDLTEDDEEGMKSTPKRANARDIMSKMGGGAPAVHGSDTHSAGKKRYQTLIGQGKTLFTDADTAEFAGAYFRYQGLQKEAYPQKRDDLAILKAANVTFDNSLGGVLVPDGFINDLIVNKPNFGAAARLTSITPMSLPKEDRPRLTDGVVMTYTSENSDTDETNPKFDVVTLVSHEIAGYVPVSIRLLNNSAVNVADTLATEFLRANGKKQDGTYFNGDNKQEGILNKIGTGTNSTFSVSGLTSTGLFGVTMEHIQALISRLPSWVDTSDAVFTMTRQVYEATLGRYEINAPGNTREDLRTGANPTGRFDRMWNGYGVIFNNVMLKGYSNGTIPILFGDFNRSIMYGVLTGSQFMRSSEHDQFRKRNVVWQAGEEFAVNPHDVNDLVGEDGDLTRSGVVGLKVNN